MLRDNSYNNFASTGYFKGHALSKLPGQVVLGTGRAMLMSAMHFSYFYQTLISPGQV